MAVTPTPEQTRYLPQTFPIHDWPWLACERCNGTGGVIVDAYPEPRVPGGMWYEGDECPDCGGVGIVPWERDEDPLCALLSPGIFDVHVQYYGVPNMSSCEVAF